MTRALSIVMLPALLAMGGAIAAGQQADHQQPNHQEAPGPAAMQHPRMDMQAMMPMMMGMHQRQMAQSNAWAVAKDGVYVVHGTELLKYSPQLKLVKRVDLPSAAPTPTAADSQSPPQTMQHMMQRMMARMHDSLAAKIAVTPDAIVVSHGNRLLKYDHALGLQAQVSLPEMPAMQCPMCQQMMARMRQAGQGGQKSRP